MYGESAPGRYPERAQVGSRAHAGDSHHSPVREVLAWLRVRALPALFIVYFGAFGAMLSGMSTSALQVASVGALCLSAILLRRSVRRTKTLLPLLAVMGAQIVSLLASPPPQTGISQIIFWGGIILVAWISTAVDARTLDLSLFAVLISVALITVYQALNYWLRVELVSLPPRLGSTLWNPNNLAFVMLLGAALAVKHKRWFWLAVFSATLALTGSLTSLVTGAVGAVLYLLLSGRGLVRWPKRARLVLPVLLISSLVVALPLVQRLNRQVEVSSLGQRVRLWQVATEMFLERPLVGMGPGSFKEAFLEAGLLEPGPSYHHAHNLYLHIAAETGLLGLAALAWVIIAAIFALRASWRSGRRDDAALGTALLVTLMLHGLYDYVYWIPSVVLLTVWTGRVLLHSRVGQAARRPAFSLGSLRASARVAQVILIGMAFFRFTAERDFVSQSLARHTTVLSLLISCLLLLVIPSVFPER